MNAVRGTRFAGTSRVGFTLIEVLVVVAIIALLASILLPSLTAAREQGKIVKCLANLGQLGKASNMYLGSNRDRFAWGPGPHVVSSSTGYPTTRTWYFGGNRGQSSTQLGTGGFYDPTNVPPSATYHDWSPAERPLNKFVYNSAKLSNNDRRPVGKAGDLRIYECPSDKGVRWNTDPTSVLKYTVTSYLEVGTSYQSNSCWSYYVKNGGDTGANGPARIKRLMDSIVKILTKKGASRAVLLYEDPADYALNTADGIVSAHGIGFKVQSWHNKYDIHNMMFLDGHAAQLPVDYRRARYNIAGSDKLLTPTWVVRQFKNEN